MFVSQRSMFLGVVIGGSMLTGPAAYAAPTVEYSAGHSDIGVAYEDEELILHYHFGADVVLNGTMPGETEYENTEEVYTRVPDGTQLTQPSASQWAFTGANPGDPIWVLSQNNIVGQPYLGTAAEELLSGDWVGDITYTFSVVSMPTGAEFSIWQTNFVGSPVVAVSTTDGDYTMSVTVGSHSHYNWGFTAEGVYELELTATGTHVTDGAVSDTGTIFFAVGSSTIIPEPASMALTGVGGLLLWRRRARKVLA